MTLQEFTEKFKAQFIDCDEITLDEYTRFRTVKSFDSLTGMAIILMIEEEFGITLPDDVFRSLSTTKEIFEYISK